MSNLKPLVLKNLTKKNIENFNLDRAIVDRQLNDLQLRETFNVNASQIAGRRLSLVLRNHIVAKNVGTKKLAETLSGFAKLATEIINVDKPTVKMPFANNLKLQRKLIKGLKSGLKVSEIAKINNVSQPAVFIIKRLLKETPIIEVVKTDAFANSDGIKKEQAREIMVEAIKVSGLYGKILTLPYKYCNIERKLIDNVSKKFSFVGCETEPDVYFEMLKTVAENKIDMECSPRPIGDKIEVAHENEYSHLLLDYCGQLNSFKNDIEMAMRNNIVAVNGTISITLNKRKTVVGGIEDEMNELNPLGNVEGKTVENAILTFIRIVGGFNYSIETVMPYKDKGKGSMILVVAKRIK